MDKKALEKDMAKMKSEIEELVPARVVARCKGAKNV